MRFQFSLEAKIARFRKLFAFGAELESCALTARHIEQRSSFAENKLVERMSTAYT